MRIRLLSINIWDLPIPMPGYRRARRRRTLLESLPALGADLVLIQEAFRPAFKTQLASALSQHSADAFLGHRRRHLFLSMDSSGGLVTFSRLSITRCEYRRFPLWRGMKPDERIGRKGCLWTEVSGPSGPVLVGNVHLYAGAGARDTRARAMQVRHLLQQLDDFPAVPTIIAGDFNMALELERREGGVTGFDLMRTAGFEEIGGGATGDLVTMSPRRNPFARISPWHGPERRLTQVFFRGPGVTPAGAPEICLDDPPVSDHFGLLVAFEAA